MFVTPLISFFFFFFFAVTLEGVLMLIIISRMRLKEKQGLKF